jgi:hypothetical protein
MLSVTNKSFMLNVIMLNVVMLNVAMLNVVAPQKKCQQMEQVTLLSSNKKHIEGSFF